MRHVRILNIILQTTITDPTAQSLIDKGLTINPYGLTVYGALVVILIVGLWRTYRDLQTERTEARKLADNAMVLMTKLEERLPSVRQFAEIENTLEKIEKGVEAIRSHKD